MGPAKFGLYLREHVVLIPHIDTDLLQRIYSQPAGPGCIAMIIQRESAASEQGIYDPMVDSRELPFAPCRF
jgi:hypothetical protein